jgi:hypothetical protein
MRMAQSRKRIFRALIHEDIVDVDEPAAEVVLIIHWTGGVHGELRFRGDAVVSAHSSPQVIDAVRPLAIDDHVSALLLRTHQKIACLRNSNALCERVIGTIRRDSGLAESPIGSASAAGTGPTIARGLQCPGRRNQDPETSLNGKLRTTGAVGCLCCTQSGTSSMPVNDRIKHDALLRLTVTPRTRAARHH